MTLRHVAEFDSSEIEQKETYVNYNGYFTQNASMTIFIPLLLFSIFTDRSLQRKILTRYLA